jgi:hypothetical protein
MELAEAELENVADLGILEVLRLDAPRHHLLFVSHRLLPSVGFPG